MNNYIIKIDYEEFERKDNNKYKYNQSYDYMTIDKVFNNLNECYEYINDLYLPYEVNKDYLVLYIASIYPCDVIGDIKENEDPIYNRYLDRDPEELEEKGNTIIEY